MAKGEAVYNSKCAACHQTNGRGVSGAFPAISGSKIATGPVENLIKLILKGKPGTAMSGFGGQLSEADVAAVVTYQRNSWANMVVAKHGAMTRMQKGHVCSLQEQ